MFDVGGGELIVILLVILLLFGPKKIPEFAQMVGKGLRKFRMAQEELTQQIRDISAEAAIRDEDFTRKSAPPTPPIDVNVNSANNPVNATSADYDPYATNAQPPVDITTPIVVPKPADNIIARNTPLFDRDEPLDIPDEQVDNIPDEQVDNIPDKQVDDIPDKQVDDIPDKQVDDIPDKQVDD
ncbi:MAG: twin-arginine translocase TatA/TatE family subunit, partial [bacterium]|nr:twin-arginine translocase TatA/TatE family subunit [bacterium]